MWAVAAAIGGMLSGLGATQSKHRCSWCKRERPFADRFKACPHCGGVEHSTSSRPSAYEHDAWAGKCDANTPYPTGYTCTSDSGGSYVDLGPSVDPAPMPESSGSFSGAGASGNWDLSPSSSSSCDSSSYDSGSSSSFDSGSCGSDM
jgi:hypothetical protein